MIRRLRGRRSGAADDVTPAAELRADVVVPSPPPGPATFGPPARRSLTASPAVDHEGGHGPAPLGSAAAVPGAIVGALEAFLEEVDGLPAPTVVVLHLTPRSVGLGGLRGVEHRGPFADVELRGGRVEAVVRFGVWGADPSAANQEMLALQGRILAAQSDLAGQGFIEVDGVAGTLPSEDQDAWGRDADYRVLFEYQLAPAAQAGGLIARVSVADVTEVTDELVRWDEDAAPPLVLRGRRSLERLSVMANVASPPSVAKVVLLRTKDGAEGAPTEHDDLSAFLDAVADPEAPALNAQFTFDTVAEFLAAFTSTGESLLLGDAPDLYQAGELVLTPAIPLSGARDRVEVTLSGPTLGDGAVVYVRAAGTLE